MTVPGSRLTTSDRAAPSSRLTEQDVFLFNEGTHRRLGERLGAHACEAGAGYYFAVWAPNARAVSVVGDFNLWDGTNPRARLTPRGSSGIWEGTVDDARKGQVYKFEIETRDGRRIQKADPYAICTETPPLTGSVLWDLAYDWQDSAWMAHRHRTAGLDAPMSIYELHLGSWRRDPARPDEFLTYREITPLLIDHVQAVGFTHVELLPVMEHPFYGSWGYQVTSYFAPSSRFGSPQDLMWMIDQLHQAGIGVVIDWVPSHFPSDDFALADFDGTHLYDHPDPRLGFHPDWGSLVFDYGRPEVRSFLASSAEQWLAVYHADALRVDAVASMLYRDYSRPAGQWLPNQNGGREYYEAVDFLRLFNIGAYADHPDIQTIAEESTAWPGVSRPVEAGGLGFGLKWDMGWMHDTLSYLQRDPIHRRYHHSELTFRGVYAFSENYVLPLSHDEVTHGKGSLLTKMPGDEWQRFANLRLLFGYQFTQPGKKLLFMGGEFGQQREWAHDQSLDWNLLDREPNRGLMQWVADLNRLYQDEPALHELDADPAGFRWVQIDDVVDSTLTYLRYDASGNAVLVALNLTPVPRHHHTIGVPIPGRWVELLNSDARIYEGSGSGNLGGVETSAEPWGEFAHRVSITIPPLGCVIFKPEPAARTG
ncbi:MAG TPA: 1,4-alpha-glucan branching protein GlgB [Mycobacteriales bacterium]|nr:1,4-alpha-glucan branching protein GlgB [Mycobacteriales bacterium]